MYGLDVDGGRNGSCHIEAWAPPVPGIAEVFHARIMGWAYPPHCHGTWAVLIVDAGAIRYRLGRRTAVAGRETVTLLPPGVVHDGRPAPGQHGFRKREPQLGRSVPHLVRSFTREFGVSPHAYLIGRRIDAARRVLLQGARPADVAADLGFYDQAHFTRHFRRHLAVTPARFGRGGAHPAAGAGFLAGGPPAG